MARHLLLCLVTATAAACTGAPEVKHTDASDPKETVEAGAEPDGPSKKEAWDCKGNLVPPGGWQQATAFEDLSAPGAVGEASVAARRKLLDKLCGGGSNCDALDARISIWKTGQGGGQACAMAVIETSDLEAWRRGATSLEGLEKALLHAAAELLEGQKDPVVTIDKIIDGGAAGGARAEWLEQRMARALGKVGGAVKDVPRAWNGQGLPPGVDVVVDAVAVSRNEAQRSVIEVNWSARKRGKRGFEKVVAAPVVFPADAAPRVGVSKAPLPPSSPDLSVRLETQRGGSLCLGERTQLWLYSSRDMHVRVFDLYGEGDALLLFPNEDHPDDRVRAGEAIPLGGKLGFEAIPAEGSEVERFLVIAAPTPRELGRFESFKGYCRVPSTSSARLHRGESIPVGATAASDSFRLIERDDCPDAPTLAARRGQAQALETLPECK